MVAHNSQQQVPVELQAFDHNSTLSNDLLSQTAPAASTVDIEARGNKGDKPVTTDSSYDSIISGWLGIRAQQTSRKLSFNGANSF